MRFGDDVEGCAAPAECAVNQLRVCEPAGNATHGPHVDGTPGEADGGV